MRTGKWRRTMRPFTKGLSALIACCSVFPFTCLQHIDDIQYASSVTESCSVRHFLREAFSFGTKYTWPFISPFFLESKRLVLQLVFVVGNFWNERELMSVPTTAIQWKGTIQRVHSFCWSRFYSWSFGNLSSLSHEFADGRSTCRCTQVEESKTRYYQSGKKMRACIGKVERRSLSWTERQQRERDW